ncbi:DUF6572 domain-containing protein [Sphingomonas sp.]|uniref:DUF6572 domain-containing protein n=1 Tax=Sphingomonas sp. TaxID=28214 RepID=UPI0025ED0C29|nr:DUF6572 domain-containing protein [Sphingomonas sp.]
MSIEKADVIDGIGLRPDGVVEMLISDHLEWNGEQHHQLLAAKIEAYANAILSGQLAESYPPAEGRQVCIKLVWQHVPNAAAVRFFGAVEQQLSSAGIDFTQTALPDGF